MAEVAGKDRDSRGVAPEPTEKHGQAGSIDSIAHVPGDGHVTKPLGGFPPGSAEEYADVMESFVGGGTAGEHKYEKKGTSP
jgi:hypothetical protein